MSNSVDPDQLASAEANWSGQLTSSEANWYGSTLFAKAGNIRVQQYKGKNT